MPLAELTQPFAGAVGCSNSRWGQQQVELINTILPKVKADPEFRKSLELWFDSQVLLPDTEVKAEKKH